MTYDERRYSQLELPGLGSSVLRKQLWAVWQEWGKFREGREVLVGGPAILGTLWTMACGA